MEVQLYIYDLSQGLARQLSQQLTGTFIEAIYHTSIVVGGVEYFYGHGIYRKIPGSTHHGRPMEILPLGKTELESEVIEEYVQSLESIYTPEVYDLFHNNCNNFTQDMSVFLVGKDIPAKIRELPSMFLNTPMGQMMRGMMDDSLRSMTQAPDAVAGRAVNGSRAATTTASNSNVGKSTSAPPAHSDSTFANGSGRPSHTLYPHPHTRLKLPGLQYKIRQPVLYRKAPPLGKLVAKLGDSAKEQTILQLVEYVKRRGAKGADEAPLPNFTTFEQDAGKLREGLALDNQFALVDLVRIAASDPRFSSWLVSDEKRLHSILPTSTDWSAAPSNLKVVTLQLACNLFNSPVYQERLKTDASTRDLLGQLISNCLLAPQTSVRALSAALVYNLQAFDHNERMDGKPDQVHVAAVEGVEEALVQAVVSESENKDTLHSLLLALGMMLCGAPAEAGIWELCEAMEVKQALQKMSNKPEFKDETLIREIIQLLTL